MDNTSIAITGNVTREPRYNLRDTKNGPMAVCNFIVGVTEKTRAGEEHRMFFECALWGEEAAKAAKLQKGDRVTVNGHMRLPNTWVSPDGEIKVTQRMSVASFKKPTPVQPIAAPTNVVPLYEEDYIPEDYLPA